MISIIDKILSQLRYSDFGVKNIETYKMTFKNNNTVNYSETPRRKNLLHLVTSGRRRYEINDKSFMVERGTLIFIPDKTKYITTAFSQNDEDCAGIGICFDLDFPLCGNGADIYYKNVSAQNDKVLELFQRIYENQKSNPLELLEHKYLFYKLLSFLTSSYTIQSQDYLVIKAAVEFINKHYKENLPIKLYADECNLSESHFRKKFRECFGKSPIDYRDQLRFAEAKRLYQNNYTAQEIAENLGFYNSGYMLKLYKKKMGTTLKSDSKII